MKSLFPLLATTLALASLGAAAADQPQWLTFPKDTLLSATVTLLPFDGKAGRQNAFYNGYRPQLRFAGPKGEVTCALTFHKPQEKLDPGETADLDATCMDALKLREDQLEFGVYEGGRKVGHGRLKPSPR